MSLKVISLNVERSKHLDAVVPFLEKEAADVVCLQEVMEYDIPQFEQAIGTSKVIFPATRHQAEGRPGVMYTGLFSRHTILSHVIELYNGDGTLRDFDSTSAAAKHASENLGLVYADIEKDGTTYRVGTTHFTWTPNGQPDDFQRTDLAKLLPILKEAGEIVFCGDFNAPRGGEIFAEFAKRYTDTIPSEYKTSLDLDVHRAVKEGKRHEIEDKMVDGLFTTPRYTASDVRLAKAGSDHLAVVATIAMST